MTRAAADLLAQVLKLPAAEREELVARVYDSLESEPLTDEEIKAELDRRAEEYRRDPTTALPWDVVKDMR